MHLSGESIALGAWALPRILFQPLAKSVPSLGPSFSSLKAKVVIVNDGATLLRCLWNVLPVSLWLALLPPSFLFTVDLALNGSGRRGQGAVGGKPGCQDNDLAQLAQGRTGSPNT